jgi:hypothetical protein
MFGIVQIEIYSSQAQAFSGRLLTLKLCACAVAPCHGMQEENARAVWSTGSMPPLTQGIDALGNVLSGELRELSTLSECPPVSG